MKRKKRKKFRNETERKKYYKIKKRNETESHRKRNVTVLFRNKRTKRKEKKTFPKIINVLFTIFMRLLPNAKKSFVLFLKRNLRFFKITRRKPGSRPQSKGTTEINLRRCFFLIFF
jgi:hypothetical protein